MSFKANRRKGTFLRFLNVNSPFSFVFAKVIGFYMKRKRVEGKGVIFIDVKHCNYIFLGNLVECINDPSDRLRESDVGTGRKRVGEIIASTLFSVRSEMASPKLME